MCQLVLAGLCIRLRTARHADMRRFMQGVEHDEDADLEAAIAASLAHTEGTTPAMPAFSVVSSATATAPRTAAARPCGSSAAAGPRTGTTDLNSLSSASHDAGDADRVTDASQGVCELAVKLPTSKRLVSKFGAAQPLSSVASWLAEKGWDMQQHRLVLTYPRLVLSDLSKSLKAHGLTSARETLVLELAPAAQ